MTRQADSMSWRMSGGIILGEHAEWPRMLRIAR
jgi:hypothetical protein